jgi:WD40 repeat protein
MSTEVAATSSRLALTIRRWFSGIHTHQKVRTLEGHTQGVDAVTWSPDGQWIGSTARDATVRIWNVERRLTVAMLPGHTDWVHGIYWFPDGMHLVSCGGAQDGSLRFWRAME